MTTSSEHLIAAAQQFVRLGFGDAIDPEAAFYSHEFLTQELTTIEAQAVLPVVPQYNAFNGVKVAAALGQFRGKVKGWKFGAAQSPLLIVVLPYWTHQAEEVPPRSPSGTRITQTEQETLLAQMRSLFIDELGAEKFQQNGDSKNEFGAWWD